MRTKAERDVEPATHAFHGMRPDRGRVCGMQEATG